MDKTERRIARAIYEYELKRNLLCIEIHNLWGEIAKEILSSYLDKKKLPTAEIKYLDYEYKTDKEGI